MIASKKNKIIPPASDQQFTVVSMQDSLREISDYKYALDESAIVAITDQKGIIKYVNDYFCKISKYTRQELIGRDHRIVNSGYHSKDFIKNIWTTIANGKLWKGELKNKAKDGTIYWVDTTIVPFLDERGKPYQYIAIRADITEQKKAEEKILQLNFTLEEKVKERTAELQKSNQELHLTNSKLDQFAHSASHDLQEPLRKIMTFSSRLKQINDGNLAEETKIYINKIEDASSRMRSLIDNLLTYAHITDTEQLFEQTDLNNILENVLGDFELLIDEKKAEIKKDMLPIISAIPLQMNQLFYNLISNALKFSNQDVPPVINITSRKLSKEEIKKYSTLNTLLNYHEIIFKDNGIGFEQQYAKQIFTIFQRLHDKETFIGTGIGLALTKKIIENHRGEIFAVAKENEGAEFHLIIPIKQN